MKCQHLFYGKNTKNILICAPNEDSEDSDQPVHSNSLISFRCPHEETLHSWLSKIHPVMHACAG